MKLVAGFVALRVRIQASELMAIRHAQGSRECLGVFGVALYAVLPGFNIYLNKRAALFGRSFV